MTDLIVVVGAILLAWAVGIVVGLLFADMRSVPRCWGQHTWEIRGTYNEIVNPDYASKYPVTRVMLVCARCRRRQIESHRGEWNEEQVT